MLKVPYAANSWNILVRWRICSATTRQRNGKRRNGRTGYRRQCCGVKGTTTGTITDFDGNFQLLPGKCDIIVSSFIHRIPTEGTSCCCANECNTER